MCRSGFVEFSPDSSNKNLSESIFFFFSFCPPPQKGVVQTQLHNITKVLELIKILADSCFHIHTPLLSNGVRSWTKDGVFNGPLFLL